MRSKALGLGLEPGCVDILAETLLPDAAAVDAELSKLQLLADGKPLTQEQARSVSPTTEFNVFAFLRQLQAGQAASVWKSILEEESKGEEPLFYLLAMLQREARQLWQLLAGEQVRMGPSDQQAKQQTASRPGAVSPLKYRTGKWTPLPKTLRRNCRKSHPLCPCFPSGTWWSSTI